MGKRQLSNENARIESSSSSSSSSSSDFSDTDDDSYVPDGGWGWVVCLGSFLVNFILDGTMFSFGVLLLELLSFFGQGKAKTAWIGSSLLGMSMFMGPLVSILLEKFSCRQITVAGTILSVVAFIVSTFSPNVEMLIVTYGIIGVQSVPLTYIPDLAVSKKIPTEQAAMLISVVGITNIIGRVLSGLITDLFRVKSTVTYTISLFTASVACFLFPWCEGFPALVACCGVFGLCMATAVSMRTIVLADHLGIDKLTRAFGTVALFQGIAFMINAPFAGYLHETFHSYLMPFSFAGLMYLLSGVLCLVVHCMSYMADKSDSSGIVILVESTESSSRASSTDTETN